jgi:hypothetical protein
VSRRRGRGLLWTGAVLTVLSVTAAVAVLSSETSPRARGRAGGRQVEALRVPGTSTVRLQPGEYTLYLSNGHTKRRRMPDLDLDVRDPQGRSVPVQTGWFPGSARIDKQTFSEIGVFEAKAAGRYKIGVSSRRVVAGRLMAGTHALSEFGGFVLLFLSAAVGLLGVVVLFNGFVLYNSRAPGPPPEVR